jgi:hypothetical protein
VRLLAAWFSRRKTQGTGVSPSDEIIEAITAIWNDVTFEELQSVFSKWIQRVTWVIEHGGSITMNDCDSFLKEFSLVEKTKWSELLGPSIFLDEKLGLKKIHQKLVSALGPNAAGRSQIKIWLQKFR